MTLIIPNNVANGLLADGDKLDQNFETIEDWGNQEAITRDGATAMTGPLLLPGPPTAANQAATKAYVDQGGPIGTVTMFAGTAEPTNWLFCRGQALSRATYSVLFAVIGVGYGPGDGSTTFNLPNFQATSPVGFNSGVNPPPGLAGKFSSAVGERYGSADGVVASHQHGVNIWSGSENTAHAHQGNTAGESNDHSHWMRGIGTATSGGGGFGQGVVADISNENFGPAFNTSGRSADHYHAFNTGGQTVNHQHPINGVSDLAGAAATNLNYHPCQSVNFLIKVT